MNERFGHLPSVHLISVQPLRDVSPALKLEWIQGLRGIACVLVVLTHARYFMLGTPAWPAANQILMPGAAGVDLFFIISGFIMAYTTWTSSWQDSWKFFVRRLTRVWPPYATMTLIWILLLSGGVHAFQSADALGVIGRSLVFLPVSPEKPPYFDVALPIGWTLEFEVYFYLVFAISMLFGRYRWIALATWIIGSVLVFPLAERGFQLDPRTYIDHGWSYAGVMTNAFVLEFLAGVIAAAVYLSKLRIPSVRLCWNLLFLVLSWSLWSFCSNFYDFHGPLNWGIPVAASVLTLALVSKTVNIEVPAPLLWLGTISYSLYLTHTATQQLLAKFFQGRGIDTHTWSFIFLASCTCCVIAYFFYELVEVRFCQYIQKRLAL